MLNLHTQKIKKWKHIVSYIIFLEEYGSISISFSKNCKLFANLETVMPLWFNHNIVSYIFFNQFIKRGNINFTSNRELATINYLHKTLTHSQNLQTSQHLNIDLLIIIPARKHNHRKVLATLLSRIPLNKVKHEEEITSYINLIKKLTKIKCIITCKCKHSIRWYWGRAYKMSFWNSVWNSVFD